MSTQKCHQSILQRFSLSILVPRLRLRQQWDRRKCRFQYAVWFNAYKSCSWRDRQCDLDSRCILEESRFQPRTGYSEEIEWLSKWTYTHHISPYLVLGLEEDLAGSSETAAHVLRSVSKHDTSLQSLQSPLTSHPAGPRLWGLFKSWPAQGQLVQLLTKIKGLQLACSKARLHKFALPVYWKNISIAAS